MTCAELPDLDPDDRLVPRPAGRPGVAAGPSVWDDPAVDWSAYDLVVLRSPWDYAPRRDEFVAWAATVPRLANPADVVAWNTDKRYLRRAGRGRRAGRARRPGSSPGDELRPRRRPASGYQARGERRQPRHRPLRPGRPSTATWRSRTCAASPAAGRLAMVQPYLPAVDTAGETALLFIPAGRLTFSHAIRKGPMLDRPRPGRRTASTRPRRSPPRTAAGRAAAVADGPWRPCPAADRLLYARVDLIPGPDGEPVVVELELTEPSLFLGTRTTPPTASPPRSPPT